MPERPPALEGDRPLLAPVAAACARPWLERRLERMALPLVACGIVVYLAVYAPFALVWPPVSSDEGRELNAFWVSARVDPNAELLDPVYGHDPLYKGGLQGLSVALALRFTGLSLEAARLVSSVWAGLLLLATFGAARRLFGAGVGAIAVMLLAASEPFLLSAHFVRPDIVVAALALVALWLVLGASLFQPLPAGLLLGLAIDVHPNAVGFLPLVALACCYGTTRGRGARLCALLAGLALGGAVFVATRVAPDPARFFESFSFWVGEEKRPPLLLGSPLWALSAEWSRFADFLSGRVAESLLLAAGLLWSSARAFAGDRAHRVVLLGLAGVYLSFSALVASKVPFYLVLYYPLLTVLVAALIVGAVGRLPGRLWLGGAATVGLALLAMGLLQFARDLAYHASVRDHDYALLSERLSRALPAGATVVAQPRYWPGLSTYRFVDISVWERLNREQGTSLRDFLRAVRASAVLIDDDSRGRLPVADRAWLSEASEKRAVVEQKYYGTVDVRVLREAR